MKYALTALGLLMIGLFTLVFSPTTPDAEATGCVRVLSVTEKINVEHLGEVVYLPDYNVTLPIEMFPEDPLPLHCYKLNTIKLNGIDFWLSAYDCWEPTPPNPLNLYSCTAAEGNHCKLSLSFRDGTFCDYYGECREEPTLTVWFTALPVHGDVMWLSGWDLIDCW